MSRRMRWNDELSWLRNIPTAAGIINCPIFSSTVRELRVRSAQEEEFLAGALVLSAGFFFCSAIEVDQGGVAVPIRMETNNRIRPIPSNILFTMMQAEARSYKLGVRQGLRMLYC